MYRTLYPRHLGGTGMRVLLTTIGSRGGAKPTAALAARLRGR